MEMTQKTTNTIYKLQECRTYKDKSGNLQQWKKTIGNLQLWKKQWAIYKSGRTQKH